MDVTTHLNFRKYKSLASSQESFSSEQTNKGDLNIIILILHCADGSAWWFQDESNDSNLGYHQSLKAQYSLPAQIS